MSFGRPVLPPDVGALNDWAMRAGSGSGDIERSGVKPAGTDGRPGASDGSIPTTSEGFASSMMARRSAAGRLDEIGCGVAPSFQAAMVASKKPMLLERAMVTNESRVTPSAP